MRTVLKTLGILAAMGLAGAAAVVGFGLYDVSARSGHLPGVSWVLHTTYQQSVRRQALPASEVPQDLDDPDLVALGARHFDVACRTCHAAPGYDQTATMQSMVPVPPHVTDAIRGWNANHLHWILYEGVKMSGMPHWPSARTDDVWSVVAFLQAVPGMDRTRYDALVEAPQTDDPAVAVCAVCHGTDGRSGSSLVPRLDIQNEAYLAASLTAYRAGSRQSGIMHHAATEVPNDALGDLAAHFGRIAADGRGARGDPDLIETGRRLAFAETGDSDVPACRACHGPGAARTSPLFPSLSGQYRPYLETQLRLWRDGDRGGADRANLMRKAAQDLTDADIAALSAYYASLIPRKPAR